MTKTDHHNNNQKDFPQKKKVSLIGSSGGGTATLGHNNVSDFVKLIATHLNSIGDDDDTSSSSSLSLVSLDTVLFVSLEDGLGFDSVTGKEDATLLFIQDGGSKEEIFHDSLDQINEMVKGFEEKYIATRIREGKVHGLISVSCEPSLFSKTLQAAATAKLPVTGTGGSSLAAMATTSDDKPSNGLRLIGNAGGSVGTTPETKAISFACAFADEWNVEYTTPPWKSNWNNPTLPSWKSVLNSCLPGFWSIALFKKLILSTALNKWLSESDRQALLFMIESYALPILCAVIMATSRRKVESVLMSAVIAASACQKTIVGGLLAGWLVSLLEEQLLYMAILNWKLPATSTNLITGGLVGIFTAALMTPISPYLSATTEQFRNITMTYLWNSTEHNLLHECIRLIVSSFLGGLFHYGSKIGWYHSIFLPIILLEMEIGDASMMGALDLLTLVLVCAGVCLGIIVTGSKEEHSLAQRGLAINLLCGDFVEACHPHMERHVPVNIAGYVASCLSAAILTGSCRSSAYLPFPIAIWLADDRHTLLIASLIAFFLPFLATVGNYFYFLRNKKMS